MDESNHLDEELIEVARQVFQEHGHLLPRGTAAAAGISQAVLYPLPNQRRTVAAMLPKAADLKRYRAPSRPKARTL